MDMIASGLKEGYQKNHSEGQKLDCDSVKPEIFEYMTVKKIKLMDNKSSIAIVRRDDGFYGVIAANAISYAFIGEYPEFKDAVIAFDAVIIALNQER